MKATVKAYLEADATLMATLTGGVHTSVEINRQEAPSAFDANGELLPCVLVRIENETSTGPYTDSSRQYLVLYFYQRRGYDAVDSALARAYVLLNRHKFSAQSVWEVRHADDLRDARDEALDADMAYSRYAITRRRL